MARAHCRFGSSISYLSCAAICLALALPASAAAQETPGPLVTAVDASRLLDHLGYPHGEARMGGWYVWYDAGEVDKEPLGLGVGVHPSAQAARKALWGWDALHNSDAPDVNEDRGETWLIVRKHRHMRTGRAILAYRNLLLGLSRAGSPREIAAAAHDLLSMALREPNVLQWGDRVTPPEVDLVVEAESVAGAPASIAFRAHRRPVVVFGAAESIPPDDDKQFWPQRPADHEGFTQEDELIFTAPKAGEFKVSLHFADADNVVFDKVLRLRVEGGK